MLFSFLSPRLRAAKAALVVAMLAGCSDSTSPDEVLVSLASPSPTVPVGATVQLSTSVTRNGGAAPGEPVTYTIDNPSLASVSGAGLVRGIALGTVNVTASVQGGASSSVTLAVVPGAPALVTRSAGEGQTAVSGAAVAAPPAILVQDAAGNPVPGVTVVFAVAMGGGTVTGGSAVTNAQGIATVGAWTLGTVGLNTLTATVAGVAPVTFTATARTRPVTIRTYSTGDATKPVGVVDNGGGIRASQWTSTGRTGAALTQASYVDEARGMDVRVLYGAGDVPARLIDRKTNQTVTITVRDTRVDFLVYDRVGQFSTGVALVYSDAKLYLAEILNNPAFNGQLSALSDRVSFAVMAVPDAGLGPLVEAPASFTAYFNATVGKPVAASALAWRGSMGVQTQAISTAALRRGLTVAGLALMGAGYATMGKVPGLAPVGLFAAGFGIVAIARMPFFTGDLLDQYENSTGMFATEGTSLNETPEQTLQNLFNTIKDKGMAVLRTPLELKKQAGDALKDALAPYLRPADVPVVDGGPPAGSSDIDGYAVDQTNTLYPLEGTVSPSGQLTATGKAGTRTIDIGGTVNGTSFTGTYSGSPGSGTLTGSTSALGSCQSQQASGGQGTFSRAFNVGSGSGNVVFSYDAYSIPDAFQVATGGATVFTTGGPVSGSGRRTIALAGSPIVFVIVSAPLSGTAWNFSLSCPS